MYWFVEPSMDHWAGLRSNQSVLVVMPLEGHADSVLYVLRCGLAGSLVTIHPGSLWHFEHYPVLGEALSLISLCPVTKHVVSSAIGMYHPVLACNQLPLQ
jgi:hypothetical protein